MPKAKVPRKLSIVKFVTKGFDTDYIRSLPFKESYVYVFLGEIPNMRGRCIVMNYKSGCIFSGYHTNSFVELTRDEV